MEAVQAAAMLQCFSYKHDLKCCYLRYQGVKQSSILNGHQRVAPKTFCPLSGKALLRNGKRENPLRDSSTGLRVHMFSECRKLI